MFILPATKNLKPLAVILLSLLVTGIASSAFAEFKWKAYRWGSDYTTFTAACNQPDLNSISYPALCSRTLGGVLERDKFGIKKVACISVWDGNDGICGNNDEDYIFTGSTYIYRKGTPCANGGYYNYDPDTGEEGCTPPPNSPPKNCTAGNPISIATGNKHQDELDFEASGHSPLKFIRFYNSNKSYTVLNESLLGRQWSHNFDYGLQYYDRDYNDLDGSNGEPTFAEIRKPSGETIFFEYNRADSEWHSAEGQSSYTLSNVNIANDDATWKYQEKNGLTLYFDEDTNLIRIQDTYGSTTEVLIGFEGGFKAVDSFSNTLTLSLLEADLFELKFNDIAYARYKIGANGDIEEARYPSGNEWASKTYLYSQDSDSLLIGIIDERNRRYNTWDYVDGLGVYSAKGQLNNDGHRKEEYSFDRQSNITVTNPFGKRTEFVFDYTYGYPLVTEARGEESEFCEAADAFYSYDLHGFRDKVTDRNGYVTDYDYNTLGLPEKITEGLRWLNINVRETTTETQNTHTKHISWLLDTRQVDVVTTENSITDYDYYSDTHRLRKITQTDLTDYSNLFGNTNQQTRTWDYTYTYHNGTDLPVDVLVDTLTIDGPLAGTADSTVYQWDIQGNLTSITNALGHETTFSDHNGRGQPQTITDPNNVITRLEYHSRGWLDKVTVEHSSGDSVTDYLWYPNGTLEQITFPDGSYLHYEYNDARHLIEIKNNLGETVNFTPNAMGDWTLAETKDASENIKRQQERAFDELGRLMDLFGTNNQHTHYGYDLNSNLETIEQYGETRTLSQTLKYDALDRLEEVIKPIQQMVNHSTVPAEVTTRYTYDANGMLTSVTDPESEVTTYWNNGFGERIRIISPDTKTTDTWYDAQGNLTDKIDARGAQVKYRYDLLGRLKNIEYLGDSSENVEYFYDEVTGNPYAKGRLTRVTDPTGSTRFVYDHRGNVTEETRTIAGQTYTTKYAYNLADKLIKITYPGGRIVNYKRNDALGRISSVTTQDDQSATEKTLASLFDYLPFGPVTRFQYGNKLVRDVPYDQDYRVDAITVGNAFHLDLGYDWFNNIDSLTSNSNSSLNQSFIYDDLHRLQDAYGTYSNSTDHIHYEYDLIGNRTLLQRSQNEVIHTEEIYDYYSDSHRLKDITRTTSAGTQVRGFTYDDAGNIDTETTFDGNTRDYTHAQNNRLITIAENSQTIGNYQHNAFGQRVMKTASGATTHFHYGLQGELLAESETDGHIKREYVYLHGQMIAVIDTPKAEADAAPAASPSSNLAARTSESKTEATNTTNNTSASQTAAGGSLGWFGMLGLAMLAGLRRIRLNITNAPLKALGVLVIAVVASGCKEESDATIYYVHTDHLGTPTVITDDEQTPVWEGQRDPFGETVVTNEEIAFDVRFPGQYLDQESGLHYNYFRNYTPATGRYVQSDPIGLRGGLSSYGYAGANPILYSDPEGLSYLGSGYIQSRLEGRRPPSGPSNWYGTSPGLPGKETPNHAGDQQCTDNSINECWYECWESAIPRSWTPIGLVIGGAGAGANSLVNHSSGSSLRVLSRVASSSARAGNVVLVPQLGMAMVCMSVCAKNPDLVDY